jgi:hypothetical protein
MYTYIYIYKHICIHKCMYIYICIHKHVYKLILCLILFMSIDIYLNAFDIYI